MKELRIEVPMDREDIIEDITTDYKLKWSRLELNDSRYLYIIKVDDSYTNNLLHELKSRGVGDVFGNISIVPMTLFIDSEKDISKVEKSVAANLEEILANIEQSAVLSVEYISLVILSAALAAFGLMSDSIVIIIGSMIVAPLLGPVALTSIGVLFPRRGLLRKGLIAETVGIGSTVAVGLLVGLLTGLKESDITSQMIERATEADPYNIVFAMLSGIAAGVIISKGQSLSMVGVAIAASLAPPAANIGLYLSLFQFEGAFSATLLLLMNIVAINASCSLMFIIFELPRTAGKSKRHATRASRNSKLLTSAAIVTFVYLSYMYLIWLDVI
jgi:uncharacterized hydrophobic protein (TIGR00341 family)